MESIQFRSKILKASKEITQSNIEEIKYLLKGEIGEGVLENINSSLDLFNALETLGWISPSSLDFLYELLNGINRGDIVNALLGTHTGSNAPKIPNAVNVKSNELIDRKVIDTVADHVASDWKRLGRSLDISEAKIDNIDSDLHKTYEKAVQVLKTWQQSCINGSANWNSLKVALEELPRYDIIRLVEENFPAVKAPATNPARLLDGPPCLAQATSVSEDNLKYTTGDSDLNQRFTKMRVADNKSEISDGRQLRQDSARILESVGSTSCIAESTTGPDVVETVLSNELKPL